MEKALVFKVQPDGVYLSDPVKITSEGGIEIVLPDAASKRGVSLLQSFSGANWQTFDQSIYTGKVYVRAIEGVPAVGVYIRVKSEAEPISAKIFSE